MHLPTRFWGNLAAYQALPARAHHGCGTDRQVQFKRALIIGYRAWTHARLAHVRQKLLDSLDDDLRYAIEVENKQRVEDIENYDEACTLLCPHTYLQG